MQYVQFIAVNLTTKVLFNGKELAKITAMPALVPCMLTVFTGSMSPYKDSNLFC